MKKFSFQSRRSGFGVCVRLLQQGAIVEFFVSVPAIGIWGLRPRKVFKQRFVGKSFSPGDRDLGFASAPGEAARTPTCWFQSRRSGFGVCVQLREHIGKVRRLCFSPGDRDLGFASSLACLPERLNLPMFQSRRSGFGVCVYYSNHHL